LDIQGQILYEMHVGTFTPEGTFTAAADELVRLRDVGVSCIELMPVADFAGRFGWGYDGVNLFAPSRLYGEPDDLRRFVDRAHALGLGVILDVVYNHLGLEGNYIPQFSDFFESKRHDNEWGRAINFDGDGSGPVREFFVANAVHWVREYHVDGFRFDATQSVHDETKEHILGEIADAARQAARWPILLVAENEQQRVMALNSTPNGWGLDALWNDDFHHACRVAMTGRRPAYYSGYRGTPQELLSSAKYGFLYQGQYHGWQKKRRGYPAFGLDRRRFVNYLQNHDQTANSRTGRRVRSLTSPGKYRALTALLLLLPETPLLFQGQEFGSERPFTFFADLEDGLAEGVAKGRREFLSQLFVVDGDDVPSQLPDPNAEETFLSCVLEAPPLRSGGPDSALHRDLIALRKTDPVFSGKRGNDLDGAILGRDAFMLRYFSDQDGDRALIINLGSDLVLEPISEPLMAPPVESDWESLWSSEAAEYGGQGAAQPAGPDQWFIPGESALLFRALKQTI